MSIVIGVCFVVSRVALSDDPVPQFIASALCIWLAASLTLALVYGPKLHILFFRKELLESSASSDFATEFKPDDIASKVRAE